MFLEAPVDAWYVWLGAAVLSVAIAGIALALPSTPPPDAVGTANALEAVAATPDSVVTLDPQAAAIRIDRTTLSVRNDGGVSHASIGSGLVVPSAGNDRLAAIAAGDRRETVYGDTTESTPALDRDIAAAATRGWGAWQPTSGDLVARSLSLEEPLSLPGAPHSSTVVVIVDA